MCSSHHPLVEFELHEIKTSIELEKAATQNIGYKTLFSTPGNRKRLRIIVAIAFFSQVSPKDKEVD